MAGGGKILVVDVQRAVAELYGLPESVMCEPDVIRGSRERKFARPRQVAMFISRRMCSSETHLNRSNEQIPLSFIGRRFGGRDHSTVHHACQQVEKLMLSDSEERHAVGEIGLRLIEGAL